jgi:hypothetical protein
MGQLPPEPINALGLKLTSGTERSRSAIPSTADIQQCDGYVSFVPKGDMLAKARTQLQAEPVLRLAEDKAGGSIRATHGRHNGRSLVPAQAGRRQ